MKKKEKEQFLSRQLRSNGRSIKEIATQLKVSKASVSVWVRDVRLTKKQVVYLSHKPFLREIIQRRVATRLKNESFKRRQIIEGHKKSVSNTRVTRNVLQIIGTALYWAEGGKSDSNRTFNFTNSDPEMIKVMMLFLRKVCKIPEANLRGHIYLHPHLDAGKAERYWSRISGIPISQFHKTSQPHNKRSSNTKDNLPFGTFNIGVYLTDLYLKMLAWIEVIKEGALRA